MLDDAEVYVVTNKMKSIEKGEKTKKSKKSDWTTKIHWFTQEEFEEDEDEDEEYFFFFFYYNSN